MHAGSKAAVPATASTASAKKICMQECSARQASTGFHRGAQDTSSGRGRAVHERLGTSKILYVAPTQVCLSRASILACIRKTLKVTNVKLLGHCAAFVHLQISNCKCHRATR